MITNIIITDEHGEFDYQAEGFNVEIVEVFEDGISFIDINGKIQTNDCSFDGNNAIITL